MIGLTLIRTRRSTLLWIRYVQFEVRRKGPSGARDVFYRAVRAVPWCKELWLESLRALLAAFELAEVHEMLRLMTEKELRFRTPLPFE